jgi:hypothetical protein
MRSSIAEQGVGSNAHGGRAAWLATITVALAAAVVYRGALGYFFGQDDFLSLARVRGYAPPLATPWRWFSGHAYFVLMRPFGVASAFPYHLASLVAHALSVALLTWLLARRFSPWAALAGGLLLAAHPAIYTAVYSVSGIGEILSAFGALAAIALVGRRDALRWLALPAFAFALMCKESVLLLPLVLLIRPGLMADGPSASPDDSHPVARRAPVLILGAISLGWIVMLFATDVFGMRSGLGSSAAYALSPGLHVVTNAATYLGWTTLFWAPLVRSFGDAVDPNVYPAAALVTVAWLAGLLFQPLRERGWLAAGATYALLLAPVLGLRNHTYHYYLYAPLIGAAFAFSALLDTVFAALAGPREAPARRAFRGRSPEPVRSAANATLPGAGLAVVLAILLVVNGAVLVHKIETYPFLDPRLRSDATVDRELIAERVNRSLKAASVPAGTPLVFWSPSSLRQEHELHPEKSTLPNETYWERNVRSALMDGLAVRVLHPELGPVRFAHTYRSEPPPALYALYDPDGGLRIASSAQIDSALAADPSNAPPP